MKQSATDSVWAKIDDADICEYIFYGPPIFILTEFEGIFDRLPLYVKGGELKVIAGEFNVWQKMGKFKSIVFRKHLRR